MPLDLLRLEYLLCDMEAISWRRSGDPWERNFARSILRSATRPDWRPSAAQERTMRQLSDKRFGPSAPPAILIEDERRHGAA